VCSRHSYAGFAIRQYGKPPYFSVPALFSAHGAAMRGIRHRLAPRPAADLSDSAIAAPPARPKAAQLLKDPDTHGIGVRFLYIN